MLYCIVSLVSLHAARCNETQRLRVSKFGTTAKLKRGVKPSSVGQVGKGGTSIRRVGLMWNEGSGGM